MLRDTDLAIFDYRPVREGRMDTTRHIVTAGGTSELAHYLVPIGKEEGSSDFQHSTPSYSPGVISTFTRIFERLGEVTSEINDIAGDYDPWEYDRPPFMSIRFWWDGDRIESSHQCEAFYNDCNIPAAVASEHQSLLLEAWRLTPIGDPTKR